MKEYIILALAFLVFWMAVCLLYIPYPLFALKRGFDRQKYADEVINILDFLVDKFTSK